MVHRSSEDSHFVEETQFPRKFPSSLSRKNSCSESINGGYREECIYYRPPGKDYFEGPFTEVQCQYWYKEGCFYNGLEFKFCPDGPIETLESLKTRNGRECPFQQTTRKSAFSASELMVKTLMGRIVDLAEELEKMKEERSTIHIASKLENDSLKNRVKELMEKDSLNEQYRRKMDVRVEEMEGEIRELRESLVNTRVEVVNETEEPAEEDETAFCETRSIFEKTAADLSIAEDVSEVRIELERLQSSIHSLDQFTFKLSHKIEKLKCKYKVIDVIGEGLNNKDGVFDRLAYLEDSVDEIQAAMTSMEKEEAISVENNDGGEQGRVVPRVRKEKEEEEVMIPVERSEREEESIPEQWYSPNEKFLSSSSDVTLSATSFVAASESIAAVATAAWPGPEKIMEVGDHTDIDNWESIDEETTDDQWNGEVVDRELKTPPPLGDTEEERMGDVDKENVEMKIVDGADHLDLIGKGLGLFLQSAEHDCEESATDSDIDRLVTAIKGSKMLQIAESLKHHFGKAMICGVCSTEEKKTELRNAIEYFEHLNRSHFKKCGGADRVLVNQFAYLLEQFKAAVPVPMALAKRQYAEREKNKPWLKREGTASPTRKTPGKKRK
ncbi:hypothetical protein PMAYCL1PPCAC_07495 [Pristionchus mayeri]|uniref:GYF domain-containing protein n=1 Tax=Pristionchus mayeri TaxID=1317129 RepID=A0AAN4ZGK3_9BILA|nr:hypothetical protein PMAYCL1PPCAC_07495 [Pristionchus mayeri]